MSCRNNKPLHCQQFGDCRLLRKPGIPRSRLSVEESEPSDSELEYVNYHPDIERGYCWTLQDAALFVLLGHSHRRFLVVVHARGAVKHTANLVQRSGGAVAMRQDND